MSIGVDETSRYNQNIISNATRVSLEVGEASAREVVDQGEVFGNMSQQ